LLTKLEEELFRVVKRLERREMTPEDAVRSSEYRAAIEQDLKAARILVAERSRDVEKAGRLVSERRVARQSLEKVKERAEERHRTEVLGIGQVEIDEAAQRRSRAAGRERVRA
jgi:flagellar biosynthesis chaperone FliJ